jgi:hypothetical protein
VWLDVGAKLSGETAAIIFGVYPEEGNSSHGSSWSALSKIFSNKFCTSLVP